MEPLLAVVGVGALVSRREPIYRRKYGFLVRFFAGNDPRIGARVYENHQVVGSLADARRVLRELEAKKAAASLPPPSSVTFGSFAASWLEAVEVRVRPKTFTNYELLVRLHLVPALGRLRLTALDRRRFEALYRDMVKQGYSAVTVRHVHVVASMVMKAAVEEGVLVKNPAVGSAVPRKELKEMRTLTVEETQRLLAAAPRVSYGTYFVMLVLTGLRPAEGLGLMWKDVDLVTGRLSVRRSLVRHGRGWRLELPKTRKSVRSVVMPKQLVAALKQLRADQQAALTPNPHGFVFVSSSGEPLHERNLAKRQFVKLLALAEIDGAGLTPYSMRHTAATTMLELGVNPKVVSERLGHSTVAMTLDQYSHVLGTIQSQAVAALEDALGGGVD